MFVKWIDLYSACVSSVDLPPGEHLVEVGWWNPLVWYRIDVALNGSATVKPVIVGGKIYLLINNIEPVSVAVGVSYIPVFPLAVALFLLLHREEVLRKLSAVLVPLYARLLRVKDVLTNERRVQIYEYIKQRGYTWPREIETRFNMAYGEVVWHLQVLERTGLIYSFRALRRRIYAHGALDISEAVHRVFKELAGRAPTGEEVEAAFRTAVKTSLKT